MCTGFKITYIEAVREEIEKKGGFGPDRARAEISISLSCRAGLRPKF